MKFLHAEMDSRTVTDLEGNVIKRIPAIDWRKSFSEIAADRVAHYVKREEMVLGSENHQRLVIVSRNENEIRDWARRSFAPEALRASWFQARINVEDDGVAEETVAEASSLEKIQAENNALKDQIAKMERAERLARESSELAGKKK